MKNSSKLAKYSLILESIFLLDLNLFRIKTILKDFTILSIPWKNLTSHLRFRNKISIWNGDFSAIIIYSLPVLQQESPGRWPSNPGLP